MIKDIATPKTVSHAKFIGASDSLATARTPQISPISDLKPTQRWPDRRANRQPTGDRENNQRNGQDKDIESARLNYRLAEMDPQGYASCIPELLKKLRWKGTAQEVMDAVPHFASEFDLTDLRNTMAHLGYSSRTFSSTIDQLDKRHFPCVLDSREFGPVVAAIDPRGLYTIRGTSTNFNSLEVKGDLGGIFAVFHKRADIKDNKSANDAKSIIMSECVSSIFPLSCLALLSNLTTLLMPLLIMLIFNFVIANQSEELAIAVLVGFFGFLAVDVVARAWKSYIIGLITGRIGAIVSNEAVKNVLFLEPAMVESVPVNAQISKLVQFDAVRDLIAHGVANTILEIPTVLILLLIMTLIAGNIVFVPIAFIVVLSFFFLTSASIFQNKGKKAGETKSNKDNFVSEMVASIGQIKNERLEQCWEQRFREISADATLAQASNTRSIMVLQSIAQTCMMLAAGATVLLGTLKVMDQAMSVGALIAAMTISWRVLSPLKALLLALPKFNKLRATIVQFEGLAKLSNAHEQSGSENVWQEATPPIVLNGTVFRYSQGSSPILRGVNLVLGKGHCTTITGMGGSGKSSVLKLITGMQIANAGSIFIGGSDTRHINKNMLRRQIAYLPQKVGFIHGTIAQNLRLSAPFADDRDLLEACEQANAIDEIWRLPDRLETRLGDQRTAMLQNGLGQKLGLARIYLKSSKIYILDDPTQGLDDLTVNRFLNFLDNHTGRLFIVASNDERIIAKSDEIFKIENGFMASVEN